MSEFSQTDRNRVRRVPQRASYDRAAIYQVIDEALICHVGFVQDEQPYVIPTIHARLDDRLVFHGAAASRMMQHIQAGKEVCVTITLLDGLVLARSVVHHSMNYRSVVLFGRGMLIEDEEEKLRALEVLTEHVVPGRWRDARRPNQRELNATMLVSLPIESASAKMRSGPAVDDEEDHQLPVWAGVLPIRQQVLDPVADPRLSAGIPVPDNVVNYRRLAGRPAL
jgi:nitroimidazol reductase NimA-like FMN-containing flavoprotein (pyridoxamine 5'-phosphate oxidase superfamily)